jgi:hypothetical protein
MARMTREFSLVLLGAGLLTAGYFLWPEEDPLQVANAQGDGADNAGGAHGRHRARHVIIIHGSRGVSPALVRTATTRGGFGRIGGRMSGG